MKPTIAHVQNLNMLNNFIAQCDGQMVSFMTATMLRMAIRERNRLVTGICNGSLPPLRNVVNDTVTLSELLLGDGPEDPGSQHQPVHGLNSICHDVQWWKDEHPSNYEGY